MECCLLVGPSSVIGTSVVKGILEIEQIPLIKLGRTGNFDEVRIEGLEVLGFNYDKCVGDWNFIIELLETLDVRIRFFILSTGYMALPDSQIEVEEFLAANHGNFVFPALAATAFAKSSLFYSRTFLFLVSTSLYSLPYQEKHYVYQIAKEQLEKFIVQFWSSQGKSFPLVVIRPWHVATPLNSGISSNRFSIDINLISSTIRKWLIKSETRFKAKRLTTLYVPSYLRLVRVLLKLLPRKVFLWAARVGAKSPKTH